MSADHDKPAAAKEIAPFLRSLRRLLDTEHASVVCWTADGVAFEIHDLAQLVAHVLPKYFKHAKYSSFQRQLNYFHFRKWTRSKTAVCTFSNPHFQRDAPELTWRISRKKSAPAAAKTTSATATTTTTTKSALAIVVPPPAPAADSPHQPRRRRPKHAAFDGLMSPTDAAAMVHHGFQPYGQPPESPLALPPWQDVDAPPLAWPSQPAQLPDPDPEAELLPLDWIDSLYSSLDAAPARGGLAL